MKELFVELRDLGEEERADAIDRACADDPVRRGRIELLLRAHDEEEIAERELSLEPASISPLPERIGEYRILERLGQGGMGVVYRARQEKPDRLVALKVVRPGWLSASVQRRFAHEAEVLGRLQHPGIAQIYEAGTARTDAGSQPFFAMELVDGKPIGEYASAAKLATAARLELIAKVCDAVEHAHQKGVIHRDLKPANILVDASGAAKVLDFGIARVTNSDAVRTMGETRTGQLIGTLAYMSPEQAGGDPRMLDTRSDVYALGVIAYELLTGQLPYGLDGKPLADAVRIIAEQPARPLGSTHRTLRGDLETIVSKSLFKEPDRRYASAAEMATDIRRYLHHEPILARPSSTIYQLKKMAQRHRGLVAGLSATLLVLIAGTVVSMAFAIQANERAKEAELERSRADEKADEAKRLWERAGREAERANRESDRAKLEAKNAMRQSERARGEAAAALEVSDFLVDLFGVSEPSRARGHTITARDLLDRGAASIQNQLATRPLSQARLMLAIGRAYARLGVLRKAGPLLERAVARVRETQPHDPLALASGLYVLGDFHCKQLEYDRAVSCFEEALALRREELPDDDREVVRTMMALGVTHASADHFDEALGFLEAAAHHAERAFASTDPHLPKTFNELGVVYQRLGRYESAAEHLEQSLAAWTAQLPTNDPNLAQGHNNLALLYQDIDRMDEAERHYRRALEILVAIYPPGHMNIALMHQNLALLLTDEQEYDRASTHIDAMMQTVDKGGHDDHRFASAALNMQARAAAATNDFDTAIDCFERCIAIVEKATGPDNVALASHLLYFSRVRRANGQLDEAIELTTRALRIRERVYGPAHVRVAVGLHSLGGLELEAKRAGAAAAHLERAIEIWEVQESRSEKFLETLGSHAKALRALGRSEEAERVEQRVQEERERQRK